jgi:hypothetical protein
MKKARRLGNGGRKSVQQIKNEQHSLSADFSFPSTTENKSASCATNRRRRRKATARTSPSKQRRRELAVYDGVDWIGTIKVAADGKSIAYDALGTRLGLFPTFQAASAAFDKPPAHGTGG